MWERAPTGAPATAHLTHSRIAAVASWPDCAAWSSAAGGGADASSSCCVYCMVCAVPIAESVIGSPQMALLVADSVTGRLIVRGVLRARCSAEKLCTVGQNAAARTEGWRRDDRHTLVSLSTR